MSLTTFFISLLVHIGDLKYYLSRPLSTIEYTKQDICIAL